MEMHIYRIYIYKTIFTTFLQHVLVCYTPSSGRATRITTQILIFFKVVIYGDLRNKK